MPETIHPNTTLGAVHLRVTDLERALDYYQQALGFVIHDRDGDRARLGAGGVDLLVLNEHPDGQPVRGTSGLYHFAIVVPSRVELAQSLKRIAETRTPVQGFADHWVSEAIYLADPDDNGIEIYRDRPRTEWDYHDGQLQMGTDRLDVDGLMAELDGQDGIRDGLHADTVIGHMHLHVADLDSAERFYSDVLGFDLMLRYGPSASFVSAGGYHHHIGLNTWAGVGAPPPPPDAPGLEHFVIHLPDADALEAVLDRLRQANVDIAESDDGFLVRDPSQNGVLFKTG